MNCTRYANAGAFTPPVDVWVQPSKMREIDGQQRIFWVRVIKTCEPLFNNDPTKVDHLEEGDFLTKGQYILRECKQSISGYALMVLYNMHNHVMGSFETTKSKIAAVGLLDLAALVVCALAIVEAIIRLCISILLIPTLCCGNTLEKLILFSGYSSLTIVNSLYATVQFTTSQETVMPWASRSKF